MEKEKIDYTELMMKFEGRVIPDGMHAWFALAQRASEIQMDIRHADRNIKMVQEDLKRLLTNRQLLLNSEREILEGLDKILPRGGEQTWESLSSES